jgi:hypothetical protein
MGLIPCWSLLCAGLLAAGFAQAAMRVVLDNGYVLTLSPDGSALAREPQQLVLPRRNEDSEDLARIHALVPDYAAGRFYAILHEAPPQRGTLVFDLTTLAPRGYLDGVVDVVVANDPKAPVLFTRSVAAGERYNGDAFDIAMMGAAALQMEVRDRRDAARVLARSATNDDSLLPQCYDRRTRSFPTSQPGLRFDHTLQRVEKPADLLADKSMRAEGRLARIVACWPGGDLLTLIERYPADTDFTERPRIVELQRGPPDRPAQEKRELAAATISLEHVHSFHLLGEGGRFVVGAGGTPQSIDWNTGNTQPARVDHPRWTQRSADRLTLYGFGHRYYYRSIVSEDYIEGGERCFDNDVSRVRVVGDALVGDTLPLPAELADAAVRQRQIDRIEVCRDADDTDEDVERRRHEIDAWPANALADTLGRFAIIAVLDD